MEKFRKEVRSDLQKKIGVKNINAVPKLDRVIVAIGIGSLVTRKSLKDFDEFEKNLQKITGQKPRLIKSKKAISNFKLREGLPVMLQVTLRKAKAYDFVDKFVKLVLPRVRDFSGLTEKSFDSQANYSIGIQNYNIFPELSLDDVTHTMGLQINLVTTTKDMAQSKALLQSLGLLFK
ncbi:MAG: 50S ribosomal protein L5 [bacterium]